MSYKHKKCYTNYIIDYNYSIIQYLILHVTTVTSLHRNNTHTHRLHNLQQYYTSTHCLWNEMTPQTPSEWQSFWNSFCFWGEVLSLLTVLTPFCWDSEKFENLFGRSSVPHPRPSLWVWSDPRSQRWHQCYWQLLCYIATRDCYGKSVTVADSQGCCSAAQRQYTVYTLYSSSTACAAHCCC